MRTKATAWLIALCLLGVLASALLKSVQASVYDYDIVSVTKTGRDEITVRVQVRYCPDCNPNYASDPAGRYVTVWISNDTGVILGTKTLVCNPINWPLSVVVARDFVFSGVPLVPGSTIIAEADVYCSWCGHWHPPPMSLEVSPVKVCIDPGHGGTALGTRGWNDMVDNTDACTHCGEVCAWRYDASPDFPNEKDFNLEIALALRALLEAENVEVVMTRTTDIDVSLNQRCSTANTQDCDIFVSIHCNAQGCGCCNQCDNPNNIWHGAETYYCPGSTDGVDLAWSIQHKYIESTGLNDRGINSANFYVLTHTAMPAALVEVCFLTNQNDFEYLDAYTYEAAQGIANGIFRYYEERGITLTSHRPTLNLTWMEMETSMTKLGSRIEKLENIS